MPFAFPSLLWWGLPLVGVPVLIHLINMMRHRRVHWAAMEFLLQSQKRHRTWILLRQLLLLALRMSAVAALVLMLAQPVLRRNWGAIVGDTQAHHVVLLDDSFSMSDRWGDTTAFAEAKKAVNQFAVEALRQRVPQRFTLLRFSHAGRLARGSELDMLRQPVRDDFAGQVERLLATIEVSQSAAGPADALAAVERLPASPGNENSILYVISDFRAREWNRSTILNKQLARIEQNGTQIHLVGCVDSQRSNLTISDLRVVSGVRAAGVPVAMSISVRNHGPAAARNVTVMLEEDGHSRTGALIEEVSAGTTVTRRFASEFATAGQHRVVARLETDAVVLDNSRFEVVEVSARAPVLVIDGSPQGEDAYFVSTALAPGGGANTGLKPQVEGPSALRSAKLDTYEAVFMLNIEELNDAEIRALEAYVRGGGGVAFFLGERTRGDFVNAKLYRDGKGLFPVPIVGPEQLLVDRLEKSPDLVVSDHPIFSVFAGERNSFINSVNVERYFATPRDWTPPASAATQVIARLRNGAPLAVEKRMGAGRVVAVLTKASPVQTPVGTWNNWGAGNPSYVVTLLEMQAYLAQGRHPEPARLVGDAIEVKFGPGEYLPKVRFTIPRPKRTETLAIDGTSTRSAVVARLSSADASGFYQVELTKPSGEVDLRQMAVNVTPEEGDLRTVDGQGLASRLKGLRYQFHRASELRYDAQQLAGFNLSGTLLAILICILLVEQLVAYSASYHRALPKGGSR